MTTSKVSQMAAMLSSPELMGMQKQSQQAGLAFGTLLSQNAGDGTQDIFSAESLGRTVSNDTVNQTAYEKESARTGYRENPVSHSSQTDAQNKLPQDTTEKLQNFDKQVKEVIAEKLGISEEEVTQQMEVMGLTVMDLMEPSRLADLVMELTGSEDIGGLLFNEGFQQILSQIGDLSQELASQLELTPEEMNQLTEELKLMVSGNPQEEMPQNAVETVFQNVETVSQDVETVSRNVETVFQDVETVSRDVETISRDVEEFPAEQVKDDAALQSSAATVRRNPQEPVDEAEVPDGIVREDAAQEENKAVAATQVQENADNPEGREETDSQTERALSDLLKEADKNDKSENRQTHVSYQTTTQNVNQGQVVEVTQTVVQTRVDVEDILRQVSQMTRVFVSQAESSIEMQLNPANLGKIYLQVVSREGVITAQIAAQNEAVKEALENQVAVLKENMNQQGMKVEAIEVTIASHEFERNLEENQQNAAREQQEEQAAKAGRRNLNLNNPDELEGVMSEEESLAAKMMAEQGNSMDITA